MFGGRREELAQHFGFILFCVLEAWTFLLNEFVYCSETVKCCWKCLEIFNILPSVFLNCGTIY
jgi:hypothetical protein